MVILPDVWPRSILWSSVVGLRCGTIFPKVVLLIDLRWFKLLHEPKIPSAIDRYTNEICRVSNVLNGVLEGREYLVGNKCTFADLAFVTWQMSILKIIEYDQAKDFPNVQAWIDRMSERPAIKAFLVERDERKAASGKK